MESVITGHTLHAAGIRLEKVIVVENFTKSGIADGSLLHFCCKYLSFIHGPFFDAAVPPLQIIFRTLLTDLDPRSSERFDLNSEWTHDLATATCGGVSTARPYCG